MSYIIQPSETKNKVRLINLANENAIPESSELPAKNKSNVKMSRLSLCFSKFYSMVSIILTAGNSTSGPSSS